MAPVAYASKERHRNELKQQRWAAALGVAAIGLIGFGCSDLADGGENCADLDIVPCDVIGVGGGQAEPNPAWDCIGETPTYDNIPPPQAPGVAYIVPILDFANPLLGGPPGLKIEVCIISDLNCMGPLPVPITEPDPMRPFLHQISFPIAPAPFQGYLKLTAPGYMDTAYYFGGPMIGDPLNEMMPQAIIGDTISMPRISSINEFYAQLSPDVRDTSTGLLALRVFNCKRERAENVTLALTNGEASNWALINNLPAANRQDNGMTPIPTDTQGVAGFANMKPTTAIVEGVTPDGLTRFGNQSFTVRANQLTFGEIRTDYAYGR